MINLLTIMNKSEFLKLMNFPKEWVEWDMYPDELAEIQMKDYKKGNEDSSEHDRFGAFNWWIAYADNEEQLIKLFKLSILEPDKLMADSVRQRMKKSKLYGNKMDAIFLDLMKKKS